MLFLPYSKLHALVTKIKMVCDVIMATQQCYINNPNPLLKKAYLTTFNFNHFKTVEAMGLKIIFFQ
jgi:hypothetical protein